MTKPITLPLASPIGARYESLTIDPKLVNAFVEMGASEKEIHVYKRPGFRVYQSAVSQVGRGTFTWRQAIYAVAGTTVYRNGVALAGSVAAEGMYDFIPGIGDTAILVLTNGTKAYTIDTGGTLTEITSSISAVIGASWLPRGAYLNGYFCFVTADSKVWNSDADAPQTIGASSYLLARIEADTPKALHKHLSYVVVIKEYYSELFYDAANAAPASPLGPVPGAKINYGTVDGRTIRDVGGEVMWVGQTREGGVTVVLVSSLKAQPVSTPPIERILQAADFSGDVFTWSVKIEGHRLYGLTVVGSNLTLVYDITSSFWYQWTDDEGNYLPYCSATVGLNREVLFQHASNGSLCRLDISSYRDEVSGGTWQLIPVTIQTPNFDGGTRLYKTLTKLNFIGDQADASVVRVEYSDDDYQTWVAADQVFDLSTEDPFVADLGSFKKRAFRFTHNANAPFRAQKIEAFIDVGGS